MKHIIIDVESLSIRTCPVITSVAAIVLSSDGYWSDFYQNINIDDQIALGSRVDHDTLSWWARQDQAVFQSTLSLPIHPAAFCQKLHSWWINQISYDERTAPEEVCVWASDPLLDFGGLVRLHEVSGHSTPWNHRQLRDARTLRWMVGRRQTVERGPLGPIDPKVTPKTPHDALSDARALAEEISRNAELLGIPL